MKLTALGLIIAFSFLAAGFGSGTPVRGENQGGNGSLKWLSGGDLYSFGSDLRNGDVSAAQAFEAAVDGVLLVLQVAGIGAKISWYYDLGPLRRWLHPQVVTWIRGVLWKNRAVLWKIDRLRMHVYTTVRQGLARMVERQLVHKGVRALTSALALYAGTIYEGCTDGGVVVIEGAVDAAHATARAGRATARWFRSRGEGLMAAIGG